MLVTLADILPAAAASNGALACINVFGFEEALSILEVAEELQQPVILATNKDMVELLGVEALAGMLLPLIKRSPALACLHLDHCYEERIVYQAIQAGYSSVMFDGSQLPLEENIRRTRQVVAVAHACGVSVEGEIGSVPYHEGRDHIRSVYTEPEQAQQYAAASGVDAVAVAIGNVHRLTTPGCTLDHERLVAIQARVNTPLVIHGTSGIPEADILRLKQTRIAKFNVGTSLRKVIGQALRTAMLAEPGQFDRRYFMQRIAPQMQAEVRRIMQLLACTGGMENR